MSIGGMSSIQQSLQQDIGAIGGGTPQQPGVQSGQNNPLANFGANGQKQDVEDLSKKDLIELLKMLLEKTEDEQKPNEAQQQAPASAPSASPEQGQGCQQQGGVCGNALTKLTEAINNLTEAFQANESPNGENSDASETQDGPGSADGADNNTQQSGNADGDSNNQTNDSDNNNERRPRNNTQS